MNTKIYSIEDPTKDNRSYPYLLFSLAEFDNGALDNRTNKPEYIRREPWCVQWGEDHLILTIINLGYVASDLVQIQYQYRQCVMPTHQSDEGFLHEHTETTEGNTTDNNLYLDFVPPMRGLTPGILSFKIKFPELYKEIANLYFRAKIFTLWDKLIPPEMWDFANDRTVIEATKKYIHDF